MTCAALYDDDEEKFILTNETAIADCVSRPTHREVLIKRLRSKFPKLWLARSEDFGYPKGNIISGAASFIDIVVTPPGDPIDFIEIPMFERYNPYEDKGYVWGVRKELHDFLELNLWHASFKTAGIYQFSRSTR